MQPLAWKVLSALLKLFLNFCFTKRSSLSRVYCLKYFSQRISRLSSPPSQPPQLGTTPTALLLISRRRDSLPSPVLLQECTVCLRWMSIGCFIAATSILMSRLQIASAFYSVTGPPEMFLEILWSNAANFAHFPVVLGPSHILSKTLCKSHPNAVQSQLSAKNWRSFWRWKFTMLCSMLLNWLWWGLRCPKAFFQIRLELAWVREYRRE